MPAPSLVIDETSVGARPVIAPALNKIGLVGHFNHGPVNQAVLVQSLAELLQKFGPTYEAGLTGMLSGYAIYAQNASAGVYVVRVAPSGVAAVKATKTFSAKVRIDAKYPGTEGNNIAVTIENATTTGKKYTITDANLGITEVWDNVSNLTTAGNNFAAAGKPNEPGAGSKLVTFVSLADTDPANAAASLLSTGTPGTNGTPAAADYVGTVTGSARSGLYAFDPIPDVRYLLAAQMGGDATVQSGLQTYAAGRAVGQGLVMGILNPPAATDPSSVAIGSLDSMRLGMFWPWIKSSAVPLAAQTAFIAPDGFIAGLLSTLKPNRAPLNKQLQGVTDLQYAASDVQVDTLSDARVNAIAATRGRGIRVRDGRTLSSDSAWAFWEIRAEYDAVETTLWDGYAWVVGEPNIPGVLWPQVEAQGDTILSAAVDDGTIVGYRPTKVVNTADDTAAGKLIIEHQVQFTVDARYITIRIDRVVDASAS
jgi:phage tail sheath protein FI